MNNPISGYQTYIIAALIIAAGVLFHFDLLDEKTFATIETILLGAAGMSGRWAVQKVEEKVSELEEHE
jgi:hypothetical protein